ncbi:MAG: exosortase/archaeosortase family protein [Thaumarchaeota archaeon]|nr:exosortase/archaeosortase family protein [Nitrososphaerota archaeon]
MNRPASALSDLLPIFAATLASLAIYGQQALLLLLKIGEVFGGVFDTTVPAYPLAGMFFVLMFVSLRRREFGLLLSDRKRDLNATAAGVSIAMIPLLALLATRPLLSDSYSFAGVALVCSWVGIAIALRPSLFPFLSPYLLVYLAAVGLVGLLTDALGDPLAIGVAWIGSAVTWLLGLPVHWSSVYISFVAAGGTPVNLYISQECSGIASISILLLVIAMIHLDIKQRPRTSLFFAIGGSALFLLLNSLRVVGLVAGGIIGGVDLLWSLHGWLGYAFYVLGYSAIILFYVRARKEGNSP